MADKTSEIIFFETPNGDTKVDVLLSDDTVWLTQAQMADLFHTTKQNVGQHIQNVFDEGELISDSVVKNFFTTASDGKVYETHHYNLDVIISVGCRVKSKVGTQFRIWANKVLVELIVKGFVL